DRLEDLQPVEWRSAGIRTGRGTGTLRPWDIVTGHASPSPQFVLAVRALDKLEVVQRWIRTREDRGGGTTRVGRQRQGALSLLLHVDSIGTVGRRGHPR